MKTLYKNSFVKDLKKVRGKKIKNRVRSMIEDAEQSEKISELAGLKKMQGGENYYRIRIGSYRVGVIIDSDTIIFVRFLHRKDIYRYFP